MKKLIKTIFLCLSIGSLTACASPDISRDHPESIELRASGNVKPEAAWDLVACITEGFQKIPQSVWHNHLTTQQVIAKGHRIELRGSLGGILMASADVIQNGSAVVYTTIYGDGAAIIKIQKQGSDGVKVFKGCLQKLGKLAN